MTKIMEVYKCNVCGNIVEVVHESGGTLSCCNQPMALFTEKTEDQGMEKHVPVIERGIDKVTVKVGSIAHPMDEGHYIEWIELICDGAIYRKWLRPGEMPEADFYVKGTDLSAREHCNIHGLWKG